MNVKINNVNYFIKEVKRESEDLCIDGIYRCGVTFFDLGIIVIADYLPLDIKRRTLIHELTHAVLFQNGFASVNQYDEEIVCELFASYADRIIKTVNKYFETKAVCGQP
jgi:Zn-dependent peptidase ImmA (M78 family)